MFAGPAPWDSGFVGLEKINTSVLSMWNPGLAKTSALDALSFRGQHSHYSVAEATTVFSICSPWGARSWFCSFSSFFTVLFSLSITTSTIINTSPYTRSRIWGHLCRCHETRSKHKVHLSRQVKIQYNSIAFEYRRFPVYNHRLWYPSTQRSLPWKLCTPSKLEWCDLGILLSFLTSYSITVNQQTKIDLCNITLSQHIQMISANRKEEGD